jgi:hypothetical protein
VNLKGITRTYDSKNIVTKLYVPMNVSSLIDKGYCGIADATTNETGEEYLYNFDYYLDRGIDREAYIADMYDENGLAPTLLKINRELKEDSTDLVNSQMELSLLEAKLNIAYTEKDAAESSREKVSDNIYQLTNLYPHELYKGNVVEVDFDLSKIEYDTQYYSWVESCVVQQKENEITTFIITFKAISETDEEG